MPPHPLLNFQRSFLAGIILAILVFSGVGIFTFMTISRHQDSAVWVEQSYEAISALQKIPADLRAMESGNRGFLLTQDPELPVPLLAGAPVHPVRPDQGPETLA